MLHPATPLLLASISAATTFAMTRVGTLDHPGARSSHDTPTPKGGGVGILAGFLVGMAFLAPDLAQQAPLLLTTLGIALIAWADDVRGFSFAVKLAAQCVAASVVSRYVAPLETISLPGIGTFALGAAGPWVALVWVVGVMNAVNFIDGLNGLASGCTAIACLFAFGEGLAQHDMVAVAISLSLAAGIAGFVPFNYPQARIFMGDVGSQPCGLLLAVLGLRAVAWPGSPGVWLMPALLSPILLDVVFTLARRGLARERVTQAHRGHLYQVAHRAGWPAAKVTLIYWLATVWSGVSVVMVFAWLSGGKAALALPPLLLGPFFGWALLVRHTAGRTGLGRW